MTPPTVICVFCGAFAGKSPAHLAAVRQLAAIFAAQDIKLIYGGGGYTGLMGEMARSLVALRGPDSCLGVIPRAIITHVQADVEIRKAVPSFKEDLFGRVVVVPDMHTRKQRMTQEVLAGGPGSGFIALSGGYGTLEELIEMTAWNQLGIHDLGVCIYNVEGFYDGLLSWIEKAVEEGFVREGNRGIITWEKTAEGAVKALREYEVSQSRFKLDWTQT